MKKKKQIIAPVILYGKTYTTLSGSERRMFIEKERILSIERTLEKDELTHIQRFNNEEMLIYYKELLEINKKVFDGISEVDSSPKNHLSKTDDFKNFM